MPQILCLTSKGLDYLLADEIQALFPDVKVAMGVNSVSFDGDLSQAYQLCLRSNLASKVLWHLTTGPAQSDQELYDLVQKIDWGMQLKSNGSLAVDFVGTSGAIRNTQFGAVRVKDAIVDQFLEDEEVRPDVEKYRPDVRVHVRLKNKQASVYIDLSGEGLHQRGYRQGTGAAPLKEHIACAMIIRSGWLQESTKPLLDPFCGSGTILIEAARMAKGIAPGLGREYWGFIGWLGHHKNLWEATLEKVEAEVEQSKAEDRPLLLVGSDCSRKVIDKASHNIRQAGFSNEIKVTVADAESTESAGEAGYIVTNPPYGERMGEMPELLSLYAALGNNFKKHFANWKLAILCSDPGLLKQLKLSYSKQYKINNGSIECILNTYQVAENETIREVSEVNSTFANRLKKNIKGLASWVKQQNIECYRIYDADIPEFNVAIDVYGDYLVVYEYAAPKNIPEHTTKKRLQDVLVSLPQVTGVLPGNIILKVRERKKGSSQYNKLNKKRERLEISEGKAKLLINLWDYLDTGLFLDHRRTREMVATMAKDKKVLNLFAYTGSVSVHAALAGATAVTTVDMSKTYIQWAEDNFKLNGLNGKQYQFVQADCLSWLKQQNQKFDLIFIDPPTFSNSKRMEDTFDVQRDHMNVISDAKRLLSEDGVIVFTNNKRHFKMDMEIMEKLSLSADNISKKTLPKDFSRNPQIHNSWLIKQI